MLTKEIIRHTKTEGYLKLAKEAYSKYPDDPIKRLDYVSRNGDIQDYNCYLLCMLSNLSSKEEIAANGNIVSNLVKALKFSVDYMQNELSDDAYKYIGNKLSGVYDDIKLTKSAAMN